VARLAAAEPRLHIAIAGRGELAATLERQAAAAGLGTRLHLLGLRQDVANVLAAADVFVLPSLSEGLPLALLEAMFAARPIVASAVGDVPVALAGGAAGLLVPPGDPLALADAIQRLLGQPFEARRLGTTAQARAAAEYDITRMVERYAALYQKLLSSSALGSQTMRVVQSGARAP
jgi:glycosyltransferase involved in cell wall biosynthesis